MITVLRTGVLRKYETTAIFRTVLPVTLLITIPLSAVTFLVFITVTLSVLVFGYSVYKLPFKFRQLSSTKRNSKILKILSNQNARLWF